MIGFLIAVMIVSSMALVSAGFHEIKTHDGKITLDGNSFNILDGYVQDMDLQMIDEEFDPQNNIRYSQAVFNQTNSSNYYSIVLIYSDGADLSGYEPDINFTNTTIKGISGHLIEVGNETAFSYSKDGAIIEIHSNTGSEIFEKIL